MNGMKMLEKQIGGTCCRLYGDPAAPTLLLQPTDESETEMIAAEAALLRELAHAPFLLAAVPVEDWNRDLSPWPAEPVWGKEGFAGGAGRTLRLLTDGLLPALKKENASLRRVYLGGYSLAGLFALWAAYRSDAFDGVAAVSPAVWFPDWPAFSRRHEIRTPRVYLSLGDREDKTKNRTLAAVGDNLRAQYALLTGQTACTLEWNPGNHFAQPDLRTAKGFAWLME